jgi:tRNA (guanine10-N2)-methyltransferase
VAQLVGLKRESLYAGEPPTALSTDPYAIIRLPSDQHAKEICRHAVLTKLILELWGCGENDQEVISCVKEWVSDECWASHLCGKTFSYKIIGYGIQHTDKSRRERMNAFGCLFRGFEKVDMKTASTKLYIIDEHEHNFEQTGTRNELIQAAKRMTFYGRLVAENVTLQRSTYVLTERPVLGPTSLDNDLAFLMANMAEVKKNSFVMDPFCGTGGLMIAATAKGGIAQLGTDIDVRVLRGEFVAYINKKICEGMKPDILQNFKAYNLILPEILVSDNSHHCWRTSAPVFDVILTDPPYGVRAGAKKIGAKSVHSIGNRDDYYPQMLGYGADEVNNDLLGLSSDLLVDGGLLVFLLHVELIDLFTEEELGRLPQESACKNRATKLLVHKNSNKKYVYANECARERQFLDEALIRERVVPMHKDFDIESAVLQILAAGTGRVLVKMRRHARIDRTSSRFS